jgi:hypothetical protein
MNVSPALPSAPLTDYLIDMPKYDDLTAKSQEIWKLINVFFTPTIDVVSGASTTVFDVSAPDAAKLFVDAVVRIHNEDYSRDSGITGIKIVDITGTTVTVKSSLGITPQAGDVIDLIGFVSDKGDPYAWT